MQELKDGFQQEDKRGPRKNVNLNGTLGLGSTAHKKIERIY